MSGDSQVPTLSAEDRWEIHDLLARYCTAIDNHELELLKTVFTDTAKLDYGPGDNYNGYSGVGADWFIEYARAASASIGTGFHDLGTSLVEATADGARGQTYVTGLHTGLPPLDDEVFGVIGWYIDVFARTDEGWRITERTFHLAMTTGNPAVLENVGVDN